MVHYVGRYGAVWQTFKDAIDYGVELKIFGKEIEPGLGMKGRRAPRKFNRTIVKSVKRTVQIGQPDKDLINTSHCERLNLTMRLFNRRFTRCTLGYSKKLLNHRLAVAIFICLYNFCRIHSAHSKSPAQAAGISSKLWTVEEVISDTL